METTPAMLDLAMHELPKTTHGVLREYRHSTPKSALFELGKHKRWYYVSAATETLYVGASIVSLGYLAKAFFYVAEKSQQRMLTHAEALMPMATVERQQKSKTSKSTFRGLGLSVKILRSANGSYAVRAKSRDANLDLILDPHGEPIVAASFLPGAGTNITEKALTLRGRGTVRIGGQIHPLHGAAGSSDFTDGYLPRHTTWKWANFSGHSRGKPLGMNLVQGFMGECECVISVDGESKRVGEGVIARPQDAMTPWKVGTSCGRVKLTFTPFALHSDNTDLGVIHAKFVQPIGLYNGVIDGHEVHDQIGVCEDQDVLW